MNLKVGLAQIAPRLGDVEANLALHLAQIEAAAAQEVELLVFPELSLTGYRLRDLAFEVALRPDAGDPVFGRLVEASRALDLVVSFVEIDAHQQFYVTAAYLSAGAVTHRHRKVYLPTYGMFEEGRQFGAGRAIRAFDTRFGRAGLLICEDFWHLSAPYLLWLDGADILIFISASPARGLSPAQASGRAFSVEHIHQTYAGLLTSFVIHCNRTGHEDGVAFWGGSTAFDPEGRLLARGPEEAALVTACLDLNQLRRTRTRLPLRRDERLSLTARELGRLLERPEQGD